MKFLLVLTLQVAVLVCSLPDTASGRRHYEQLKSEGFCWESVVSRLEARCSDLSDSERSRLALALANCHLRRSGLAEVRCEEGETFEHCTKEMEWRAWTAYTEFFTHVFDICGYLAEKVWRDRTSLTVKALSESSEAALLVLDQATLTASSIKRDQDELRSHIEASRSEVTLMKEQLVEASREVREEMKSQQEVVGAWMRRVMEGLEDVSRLQEMVFGELFDLKSLLYYLTHAVLVYICTSITETAHCRSRLLFLLILQISMERLLHATDSKLWKGVSTLRLVTAVMSFALVLKAFKEYRDVNRLNHELLLQLLAKISARTKALLTSEKPKKAFHHRVFFPLDRIREVRPEQESEEYFRPGTRRLLRF